MKGIFLILVTIILVSALILGGCTQPTSTPAPASSSAPPPTSKPASTTTTSAPATTSQPASSAAQPPAQSQQTIKIGILAPLTGPMAITSKDLVDGTKFAFDEVNNQVAGKKVEAIIEDDGAQTQMAVDKARKLVEQDNVAMVLGPLSAGTKMAVADYMSKVGRPNLPFGPSSWPISNFKWTFTVEGSEPAYAYTMANYAYNQMGKKKVTIMTEDTVAGHSFLDAFMKGFKDAGGQIVQEQYTPWPNQDFAPYLTNLKAADAIVAWYEGQDSVIFLNQMDSFGIRKKMPLIAPFHGAFFLLSIVNHALKPEAAAALVGEKGPTEYTALIPSDTNKKFVAAFQQKMGYLADEGNAIAYESIQVAFKALEATKGDTTPDKLRQAIMALDMEVPSGHVKFDPQTNFAIRNIYIFEIGKYQGEYNWIPDYVYENVPPPGNPTPPGKPIAK